MLRVDLQDRLCRLFARFIPMLAAALPIAAPVQLFAQSPEPRSSALSPQESLANLQLDVNFQASMLAHEPQVIDPVDAVFDDRGRLWVVEMRDYPYPTNEIPAGCVRVLSDEDADGHFETSVVFADHLDMPTGIALWRDGAVVTLAGQVVWFRDTDDDLKADSQQVWIEGFSRENEQLRANHPRLGPDGWWYIASGLRGGNVIAGPDFRRADSAPLVLGSRDVRFNPQSEQMEAVTGPAQFGLCFDSVGNRLFCSNRNPAVQVRFEQEDLVGNPLAGLIPSVVDLIPAGEQSRVYPLVSAWTTSNLHSGQFTAACGVFCHEFAGEVCPAVQAHGAKSPAVRVFACEPTGSLVHSAVFRNSLDEHNAVSPVPAEREWLASRDAWFRPVNIALAPDGGLLIVDMHRAVIEHPQWVPDELKKRTDERWGNANGRIVHVAMKDSMGMAAMLKTLRAKPLSQRASHELVQFLSSENPWLRDTARRLLIEREAIDQLEGLKKITVDRSSPSASRIAALQLAAVLMRQLPAPAAAPREFAIAAAVADRDAELVSDLLVVSEPDASLKIAALRIAKTCCASHPQVIEQVLKLGADSDQDVLLECLRCLGGSAWARKGEGGKPLREQPAIGLLIGRISQAIGTPRGPEVLAAAAQAFKENSELVLLALLDSLSGKPLGLDNEDFYPQAAQRLSAAVLDTRAAVAPQLFAHATGILARQRSACSRSALAVLSELIGHRASLPELQDALAAESVWDRVRTIAEVDEQPTDALRYQAIAMLAKSSRPGDLELLPKLAQAVDLPVRTAALRAWAATADSACDEYLLNALPSSSPQLLQVIVELIAQKPARLAALANQLSSGAFSPKRLGAVELTKLVARAKGETQQQLSQALDSIVQSDRAQVLADYQACLSLSGDALRGREIFTKHCASCHRIAGIGVQVAPDISDSRTQQPAQILTNVLDPNRAIDNNYFRYVALTHDDQVFEGIIAEETSDSIVLRGQNNTRNILKRADLQELKATGTSMMPEGLESQIDHQAMADLISFVKNWRYLDGSIPK